MQEISYPALYHSADDASNKYQRLYLRLIRAEYGLLFVAAVLSMSIFTGTTFYLIYAAIFVASMFLLITRSLMKPEQDWYKCRALAESVKTMTWRYMMRSAPFGDAVSVQIPRSEFRNQLHAVFKSNENIAEKITSDFSGNDQISAEMDTVRAQSLDDRKTYYIEHRVRDQRKWYAKKSKLNKVAATKWLGIGITAYAIATALVLIRIKFPDLTIWPIEPVIVFASSVIGWMQIKKFNELSTAYNVTAHEIGLINPKIDHAVTEDDFSDFVNESEQAFSREHTLWIARQTT